LVDSQRTIDVDEMQRRACPEIRAFHAYWDGKRDGRLMPRRADIDPIEMKPWLTTIQLVDVSENPRRLQYRLLGQDQVEARGFNATGLSVDEGFICSSKEYALANYSLAIDNKTMVFDWSPVPYPSGALVEQQTIFLPLSSNGVDVDKVITFSVVFREGR
jgi:hypothetical protein